MGSKSYMATETKKDELRHTYISNESTFDDTELNGVRLAIELAEYSGVQRWLSYTPVIVACVQERVGSPPEPQGKIHATTVFPEI